MPFQEENPDLEIDEVWTVEKMFVAMQLTVEMTEREPVTGTVELWRMVVERYFVLKDLMVEME